MDATYIILCNGKSVRWNINSSEQKWMATIDGQPNLHRTADLLCRSGIPRERIYCATGSEHTLLVGTHCGLLAVDRTESTCETILCAAKEDAPRTVILLGDVAYSDRAIKSIIQDTSRIQFFGRPGASRFSFKRWGELFAISFTLDGLKEIKPLVAELVADHRGGRRDRAIIWDIYSAMTGSETTPRTIVRPLFTVIDDETDDYDTKDEYDQLVLYRELRRQRRSWRYFVHLTLPIVRHALRRCRHSLKQSLGLRQKTFIYVD